VIFNNQKELIYRFISKEVEFLGLTDESYHQETAYQPILSVNYCD